MLPYQQINVCLGGNECMSKYSGKPTEGVSRLIGQLGEFSPGVVVVRSPNSIASVNLVGEVYIGEDAGETVLAVREDKGHIHVMWERISGFSVNEEKTPGGNEPVIWLIGEGERYPVIRIFFPGKTIQELEEAIKID